MVSFEGLGFLLSSVEGTKNEAFRGHMSICTSAPGHDLNNEIWFGENWRLTFSSTSM